MATTARPTARILQKERLQTLKVRPNTAIERAPSLTTHAHPLSAKPHVLTVRLMPCAAQASGNTGWACVAGAWHAARAAVARVWPRVGRAEVVHVRPPPRVCVGRWCGEAAGGRCVGCQGGVPVNVGACYAR